MIICGMNECSELRLVSISAPVALGFYLPRLLHQLQKLESFSPPALDEILEREPDWPSHWWGTGQGMRDSDVPAWLMDSTLPASLEPLCQLPRGQSCLCLPACIFTLQCASHPTPNYQGNCSFCFWHHPGFSLLFFSPFWKSATLCLPAKQKASSALPRRSLLLQSASAQTPVSTEPPTMIPTHRSSKMSCKI